jgi:hypothetical protein
MHFAIIQAFNQGLYCRRLITGRLKPAVDFKLFFHLSFSVNEKGYSLPPFQRGGLNKKFLTSGY